MVYGLFLLLHCPVLQLLTSNPEKTMFPYRRRFMGLMRPRRVVRGTMKKEKNHHFVTSGILATHALKSFWASISYRF